MSHQHTFKWTIRRRPILSIIKSLMKIRCRWSHVILAPLAPIQRRQHEQDLAIQILSDLGSRHESIWCTTLLLRRTSKTVASIQIRLFTYFVDKTDHNRSVSWTWHSLLPDQSMTAWCFDTMTLCKAESQIEDEMKTEGESHLGDILSAICH